MSDARVFAFWIRLLATIGAIVLICIGVAIAVAIGFFVPYPAHAAEPEHVRVPDRSALYQLRVTRAVQYRFSDTALVSQFAAQFHQESSWRPDAASKVAHGLGQFTLPTANWIASICPDIGPPDRSSADWSIAATVCYMHWLMARNSGATPCDRRAFALSDYNGGMKWRQLEQAKARDAGSDPSRWFLAVALFRADKRALSAWTENRDYVERILHVLEPAYRREGWQGRGVCS